MKVSVAFATIILIVTIILFNVMILKIIKVVFNNLDKNNNHRQIW